MKEESPCKVLIWFSELQITDHNHRLIYLSPLQLHILADEFIWHSISHYMWCLWSSYEIDFCAVSQEIDNSRKIDNFIESIVLGTLTSFS